jgi:glycosyltransferase involved in cell wall biosynthesis
MSSARLNAAPLQLLSVVISARNEEACIASTVEHLYLELRRHNVPNEIIVVDDSSTDATWSTLESLKTQIPSLIPVQNRGQHGFGRAVSCGFDRTAGDAVVVIMADESDDCRDVGFGLCQSLAFFLSGRRQLRSSAPERYALKLPEFLESLPAETNHNGRFTR